MGAFHILLQPRVSWKVLVVDAYNKENVLHFYEKNGFKFLYSTENLEKEANHIPEDEHLESRMMYLDLLGYNKIKNIPIRKLMDLQIGIKAWEEFVQMVF